MGIREVTRNTAKAVDALIHEGRLTPAGNPGGIDALLAIKPVPARDSADTAETVSEQREDHL